uniref:CCHC-type domain-containing protein n=1 Tax=Poecilia formosa TaxID=48698 RepID=A0A096LWZ1_POEFO
MWVRSVNAKMTEHSSQQPNPADTIRRALAEQQSAIQSHEKVLRDLSASQAETNRRLEEIANFLQTSSQQPPVAAPDPTPDPAPVSRAMYSEIRPPSPERFDGDSNKCKGFIMQCSLIFNHSPQSFLNDGAKIAFIIAHLSGRALSWAEAKFPDPTNFACTFTEFLADFKQVFTCDPDKTANSRELWSLKQGQRSVADFAIDFRIMAAASAWNPAALKSAYFHALSDSIKDELATLDEPDSLEDLIKLTIRLDNRIRSRNRERSRRTSSTRNIQTSAPVTPTLSSLNSPEPEPMQLGRTRLSPEERQNRMRSRRCLYCGASGHFIASCPVRLNPPVRQ